MTVPTVMPYTFGYFEGITNLEEMIYIPRKLYSLATIRVDRDAYWDILGLKLEYLPPEQYLDDQCTDTDLDPEGN